MHRPLAISEGPSSSCTEVRVRTRPKLQWTKSFPPYNQCIGGLGEWDNELNPETSLHHQQHLRQEVMKDDGKEDTERKEDAELNAICARDEVRLKWRARRKERLGGSYDADADRWERGRWSGKRRVEETGGERGREDEEREGSTHMPLLENLPDHDALVAAAAELLGNFQLSGGGEVLKLYTEEEAKCLDCLMRDPLRPFVPQYHGMVTRGEQCYMRLEDLLSGLRRPVIMDCKMGLRTYQEEELAKALNKATFRSDMYQKMVKMDPSALSAEEHAQRGVTKWRYLQWRDTTSSTSTLGFRIEGIMMADGSVQRDFKKILTSAKVTEAFLYFTKSQLDILVIGSSLLFVHEHSSKASVWMIDFGKTTPVHDTIKLRHNIPWTEGSREDGYLIGLTSLITSLSQAISVASCQEEDSSGEGQSIT
ncbi:putative inositol-trisphosphate 3-kinase A-like [Scophthalmus maximus]|uniref:Kinase n=1 Tax=Scophthalmus maximus TaxID=52904 RepID=A0A2U9C6B1_SCOMX|nr:putative inositol-trisphosphate 3-kinase A-like [Scophthalmus maximus]